MSETPETCYATTGDGLHIAYQVEGTGPLPLVELANGTNFSVDATAEQPRWQAYVDRLGSFARLIRFDLRGIGLSDPLASSDPPTVEQWAGDALAVLDDQGIERAAVLGVHFGGLAALFLAATHPERVHTLVVVNGYARLTRSDDYPFGVPASVLERFKESLLRSPIGDRRRPPPHGPEHGLGRELRHMVAPRRSPGGEPGDGAGGVAGVGDGRATHPRRPARADPRAPRP